MNTYIEEFPLKQETEIIIGIGIEIHKELGFGFLEIVYKDAYEYEFHLQEVLFQREKEFIIFYKDVLLRHKFYADFIVFQKVILEVKAKEKISETVETAKEKVNNLIHDGSEDAKETVENTTNRIEEDAD